MSDSVFEQGNKLIDICAEERAQWENHLPKEFESDEHPFKQIQMFVGAVLTTFLVFGVLVVDIYYSIGLLPLIADNLHLYAFTMLLLGIGSTIIYLHNANNRYLEKREPYVQEARKQAYSNVHDRIIEEQIDTNAVWEEVNNIRSKIEWSRKLYSLEKCLPPTP